MADKRPNSEEDHMLQQFDMFRNYLGCSDVAAAIMVLALVIKYKVINGRP